MTLTGDLFKGSRPREGSPHRECSWSVEKEREEGRVYEGAAIKTKLLKPLCRRPSFDWCAEREPPQHVNASWDKKWLNVMIVSALPPFSPRGYRLIEREEELSHPQL